MSTTSLTLSTVIDGARGRLAALRKKLAAQQQAQAKRSSISATPGSKATPTLGGSPAGTPAMAGTSPR